jgi:hypothetical protein
LLFISLGDVLLLPLDEESELSILSSALDNAVASVALMVPAEVAALIRWFISARGE